MNSPQLVSEAACRRVRRSFAFVDLCGFCDFAEAQGDDAAAEEVSRLRATVRWAAAATSVMVDKWLGDGAMLVGDDSELLVTSTIAIAETHLDAGVLPIRAGIASGDVLLLDGDSYLGRPVNLAARLTDRADPHQVLASVQGLRLPSGVVVEARNRLQIKGFAEPVSVATLRSKGETGESKAQRALASTVDGLAQPFRALLGVRGRPTRKRAACTEMSDHRGRAGLGYLAPRPTRP